MSTLISDEIKDIIDMNQFDSSATDKGLEIIINVSDSFSITSPVSVLKIKQDKISIMLTCTKICVNELLRARKVKSISVSDIVLCNESKIKSIQFTKYSASDYHAKLVVDVSNN